MPVSGLVVTLAEDALGPDVERALLALGGVALGEAIGSRLPVTLVTDGSLAHARALEAIETLRGVSFVDFVFHDFEDVRIAPATLVRPRERSRRHAAS